MALDEARARRDREVHGFVLWIASSVGFGKFQQALTQCSPYSLIRSTSRCSATDVPAVNVFVCSRLLDMGLPSGTMANRLGNHVLAGQAMGHSPPVHLQRKYWCVSSGCLSCSELDGHAAAQLQEPYGRRQVNVRLSTRRAWSCSPQSFLSWKRKARHLTIVPSVAVLVSSPPKLTETSPEGRIPPVCDIPCSTVTRVLYEVRLL